MVEKIEITSQQREMLFEIIKARFEKNMSRHKDLKWTDVQEKLTANNEKNMVLERNGKYWRENLMSLDLTARLRNIFFMTAQAKVL